MRCLRPASRCVCKATHMRNVPGRKRDIIGCQWIAELHEHGCCGGASSRPPRSRRPGWPLGRAVHRRGAARGHHSAHLSPGPGLRTRTANSSHVNDQARPTPGQITRRSGRLSPAGPITLTGICSARCSGWVSAWGSTLVTSLPSVTITDRRCFFSWCDTVLTHSDAHSGHLDRRPNTLGTGEIIRTGRW